MFVLYSSLSIEVEVLELIYVFFKDENDVFFSISNFRRVMNFVFFLLGDSPASEVYVPTFRNTVSSIFIGDLRRKNWYEIARVVTKGFCL
jgi:hypothetical protein